MNGYFTPREFNLIQIMVLSQKKKDSIYDANFNKLEITNV